MTDQPDPCTRHPHAPTIGGMCGGCTQYPADVPATTSSESTATNVVRRLAPHIVDGLRGGIWKGKARAEARGGIAGLDALLGHVAARRPDEDGTKQCPGFVPDTPRAPSLCADCGNSTAWHRDANGDQR